MSKRPRKLEIERLVQTPFDPSPRAYMRAACERLAAAEYLLGSRKPKGTSSAAKYYLEAIYLGGYAVECVLKALILETTAKSKRHERYHAISSGASYHRFDVLEHVLRVQHRHAPETVRESIRIIPPQWSTDLRYVGAIVPRAEAIDFLKHAKQIVEWVERSL